MLTHAEWVCSYSHPFADLLLAQQIVEVFFVYEPLAFDTYSCNDARLEH